MADHWLPIPVGAPGLARDQAVALARHLQDVEKELGNERFDYLRGGLDTMRNVMVANEEVQSMVNTFR